MNPKKYDSAYRTPPSRPSTASLEAEGQHVLAFEVEDERSAAEPYGNASGFYDWSTAPATGWRASILGRGLRELISHLADLFPNHVFYGKEFIPSLTFVGADKDHASDGNTALIATAVAASRSLEPGAALSAEFTTLHHRGLDVGDFVITIERKR